MHKFILYIFLIFLPTLSYAMSPQDVMREIYAMANNKKPYDKKTVTQEDISHWINEFVKANEDFNSKQLALSLHSLATLKQNGFKFGISPQFFKKWKDQALKNLDQSNRRDYYQSREALRSLGQNPDFLKQTGVPAQKIRSASVKESKDTPKIDLQSKTEPTEKSQPPLMSSWSSLFRSSLSSLDSSETKTTPVTPKDLSPQPPRLAPLARSESAPALIQSKEDTSAKQNAPDPSISREMIEELRDIADTIPPNDIDPFAKKDEKLLDQQRKKISQWMTIASSQIAQNTFSPVDLSSTLMSLTKLKKSILQFEIPLEFYRLWEKSAIQLISKFRPRQLSNSIYAMSQLGYHPSDEFLRKWKAQARHKQSEFNQLDFLISIYSILLLENSGKPTPLTAFKKLGIAHCINNYNENKNNFKESNIQQLHLMLQYFYLQEEGNRILPQDKDTVQKILQETASVLRKRRNWVSSTETMLGNYLKSKFQKIQNSYWSEILGNSLDFALPEEKIAIQFDGPNHFVRDINGQEIQRPQDLFLDELLRRAGWRVIRIPYRYFQIENGKIADTSKLDQEIIPQIKQLMQETVSHSSCVTPRSPKSAAEDLECNITPVLDKLSKDTKEDSKKEDNSKDEDDGWQTPKSRKRK